MAKLWTAIRRFGLQVSGAAAAVLGANRGGKTLQAIKGYRADAAAVLAR